MPFIFYSDSVNSAAVKKLADTLETGLMIAFQEFKFV
jgi:hypothetical protein